EVSFYDPLPPRCHACARRADEKFDIDIVDDAGCVLVMIRGLEIRALEIRALSPAAATRAFSGRVDTGLPQDHVTNIEAALSAREPCNVTVNPNGQRSGA